MAGFRTWLWGGVFTVSVALQLGSAQTPAPEPPPPDGVGSVCFAHATPAAWQACGKLVLSAFTKAFNEGCGADGFDGLVASTYPFMKEAADAIVKVRVDAFAACDASAFGCVEAGAFASSSGTIVVAIISSAVAQASIACSACDSLATQAMAGSFIQLMLQADRRISQLVAASTCVGPDSSAPAVAYSACASQVLAHKLVFAFAKAIVGGQCTNLKEAATVAEVGLLLKADNWCDCQGYEYVCSASDNGCAVGKQDTSALAPVAKLAGFKGHPSTYAAFVSECKASTVSQHLAASLQTTRK